MNQRALIVAVILFVVIVLGMFAYARFKSAEMSVEMPPPQEKPAENVSRIDAKHYFKDGKHTVAGEIMMPNACDLLKWDAVVRESSPEQVTIAFDVVNNTKGVCAQVITLQRFKVEFEASEAAIIDATFKGREVQLNLVPARPDENPDEFDLFIKG